MYAVCRMLANHLIVTAYFYYYYCGQQELRLPHRTDYMDSPTFIVTSEHSLPVFTFSVVHFLVVVSVW